MFFENWTSRNILIRCQIGLLYSIYGCFRLAIRAFARSASKHCFSRAYENTSKGKSHLLVYWCRARPTLSKDQYLFPVNAIRTSEGVQNRSVVDYW